MEKSENPSKLTKQHQFNQNQHPQKQHSWVSVRNLFTCKYVQVQQQQQRVQQQNQQHSDQQQQEQQYKEKRQAQKKKPPHEPPPPPPPQQLLLPEEGRKKLKQKQDPLHPLAPTEEIDQKSKKMKKPMQEPPPPPCTAAPEESNQKSKKIKQPKNEQTLEEMNKKSKKMKCSGSLCSNTKVMQRPEASSLSPSENQKKRSSLMASSSSSEIDSSNRSTRTTLSELNGNVFSSSSSSHSVSFASPSISGSFRTMPFRKLSGCYECRMVVDPVLGMTRDPSLRATIFSCPVCGEIFTKADNLELHQTARHAVSELGPEDTSKNIVEIIFQSSWLKKQAPVCKIDRILKVQNTPKTISRFEEYRDSIKAKATRLHKKHPRCIADGNELLRFHCTTFMCSLGLNGSSNLCNSIPNCNVCSIIKNGFKVNAETVSGFIQKGILTTATSGKAHDRARVGPENGRRAMLVCRVIAGRVKKNMEGSMEEYDSLAVVPGTYPNLDELYVFNPKAILPCFVVIYTGF